MRKRKLFWVNLCALFFITLSLRAPISIIGPLTETLGTFLSSTQIGILGSIPPITFGIIAFLVIFLQPTQAIFIALLCLIFGILFRSLGADPYAFAGFVALYGGTFILSSGIAIINVLLPVIIKNRYPQHINVAMSLYTVVAGASVLCGILLILPILNLSSLSFAMGIWVVLPLLGFIFYFSQFHNGRLFRKKPKIAQTKNLYKNFTAWNITLFMGFQAILSYSVSIWLPQIVSEAGFGIMNGTKCLLLVQIVAVIASLLCPIVLKKLTPREKLYLILILSGIYALFPFAFYLSSNYFVLLFASLLGGISIGACFSLALLFISWKTSMKEDVILLSSMSQGVGYLMGALGPYAIGVLHTIDENFDRGLLVLFFCGLGLCISAYCINRGKSI